MWECLANFSPSFCLQLFGREALIIGATLLGLDHPAGTGSHDYNRFSLSVQGECKVGKRRAERHVLLFEKLLLILKKKDAKHYTYKGHILVSLSPASVLLCVCVQLELDSIRL